MFIYLFIYFIKIYKFMMKLTVFKAKEIKASCIKQKKMESIHKVTALASSSDAHTVEIL